MEQISYTVEHFLPLLGRAAPAVEVQVSVVREQSIPHASLSHTCLLPNQLDQEMEVMLVVASDNLFSQALSSAPTSSEAPSKAAHQDSDSDALSGQSREST